MRVSLLILAAALVVTVSAEPLRLAAAPAPTAPSISAVDALLPTPPSPPPATGGRWDPPSRAPAADTVWPDGRPADDEEALAVDDYRYFYAGAAQFAEAAGGYGTFTAYDGAKVRQPETHTLVELAVQSRDLTQIVEVGLTVNNYLGGAPGPHLFVFYWVDGKGRCYDLLCCGFVPVGGALNPPGARAIAGSTHRLAIRHHRGRWWIGDWFTNPGSPEQGGWIGYFPDTLWSGKYTRSGYVQWFGEVVAHSLAPCTDMGSGRHASSDRSGVITGMELFDAPPATPFTFSTDPNYYSATPIGRTGVRYGGPGAC